MRFGFAFVDAAPNTDTVLHGAYRLTKTPHLTKLSGYVQRILAYCACCFDHAASSLPHVSPTTHQQQPVLYQHRQQLGVHLTHNPQRIAGAPLVYAPLAFPQLEQQLDLPARASQHQYFLYAQLLPWYVSRKDIPLRSPQPLGAQVVPASLGFSTQSAF